MRFSCVRLPVAAALVALVAGDAGAQPAEKRRVATISGKRLAGGLVTGLAWDGGTLIIQTAAVESGEPKAHYFAVAAPGVELRSLDTVPASVESYWKRKAARRSPTGLGAITLVSGSKLPMYGIASQEKRLADAWDMGGSQNQHGGDRQDALADHSCEGSQGREPGREYTLGAPARKRSTTSARESESAAATASTPA